MKFYLNGLDCPNCAAGLETELRKIPKLERIDVNFATLSIEFPMEFLTQVQEVIRRVEPGVTLVESLSSTTDKFEIEQIKGLPLLILAGIILMIGLIFHRNLHITPYSWAEYALLFPPLILVGGKVFWRAFKNVWQGRLFDESFLMSIATLGAIALHQLPEALAVMLFNNLGEILQARAVTKSRHSMVSLLKLQPEVAHLFQLDGTLKTLHPEMVMVGAEILVKPGEKIPLDGEVNEGSSWLNTAALTGESVPRRVMPGESVLAGMINGQEPLTIQVSRTLKDSALMRILKLVEEAANRKAPTEQLITTLAKYYTPMVVISAFLVALLPPLFLPGADLSDWIYRALVLLMISCPCALMVSVPLGYFGGIGAAARQGILIKGANFLDALTQIGMVAFDKTGTLTQGVFRVQQVKAALGFEAEEILATAAAVELYSNHPIAKSIREAYGKVVLAESVSNCIEIPGAGITAWVSGKSVALGNERLLQQVGVSVPNLELSGTIVHLAIDSQYAGHLVIEDELKENTAMIIGKLHQLGIKETVILSGDQLGAVKAVAEKLEIKEYYGGLLPEDKVSKVEELAERLKAVSQKKLVFVGDGVNDAPVLARADLGVAMGGLGRDVAIEAADLVLMEDDPMKLVTSIEIARYTRKIIWQNIIFAFGFKLLFIILGILGVASIWEAVFADVGVALLAVFNAMRIIKRYEKESY